MYVIMQPWGLSDVITITIVIIKPVRRQPKKSTKNETVLEHFKQAPVNMIAFK